MACQKKKFDRIGAQLAVAECRRKNREEFGVYHCAECKAFHLTRQRGYKNFKSKK